MGEWDAGHVYAVPQGLRAAGAGGRGAGGALSNSDVEEATKRFIRDFRVGTVFIYRERLLNNAQQGRYHLEIDLEHLKNFSEELHDVITKQPAQYLENVRGRRVGPRRRLHRDPKMDSSLPHSTHTPTLTLPGLSCCRAFLRWKRARGTF